MAVRLVEGGLQSYSPEEVARSTIRRGTRGARRIKRGGGGSSVGSSSSSAGAARASVVEKEAAAEQATAAEEAAKAQAAQTVAARQRQATILEVIQERRTQERRSQMMSARGAAPTPSATVLAGRTPQQREAILALYERGGEITPFGAVVTPPETKFGMGRRLEEKPFIGKVAERTTEVTGLSSLNQNILQPFSERVRTRVTRPAARVLKLSESDIESARQRRQARLQEAPESVVKSFISRKINLYYGFGKGVSRQVVEKPLITAGLVGAGFGTSAALTGVASASPILARGIGFVGGSLFVAGAGTKVFSERTTVGRGEALGEITTQAAAFGFGSKLFKATRPTKPGVTRKDVNKLLRAKPKQRVTTAELLPQRNGETFATLQTVIKRGNLRQVVKQTAIIGRGGKKVTIPEIQSSIYRDNILVSLKTGGRGFANLMGRGKLRVARQRFRLKDLVSSGVFGRLKPTLSNKPVKGTLLRNVVKFNGKTFKDISGVVASPRLRPSRTADFYKFLTFRARFGVREVTMGNRLKGFISSIMLKWTGIGVVRQSRTPKLDVRNIGVSGGTKKQVTIGEQLSTLEKLFASTNLAQEAALKTTKVTTPTITQDVPVFTPSQPRKVSLSVSQKTTRQNLNVISQEARQDFNKLQKRQGVKQLKQLTRTKSKQAQRGRRTQLPSVIQLPKQEQLPSQEQLPIQRRLPQQRQASQIRNLRRSLFRRPSTTPIPTVPTIPTPEIPETGFPGIPRSKGLKLKTPRVGSFPVFGRRFGEFRLVGIGRTPQAAKKIGKRFARTTLAATFKIPGVTNVKGFRTKREDGQVLFIEPKEQRLKKGGREVREIKLYRNRRRP